MASSDIFMATVLQRNANGNYKIQPTHTMHPRDDVPGMDRSVYGKNEEVRVGLIDGDHQKPQILDRTLRSWKITPIPAGYWHCIGCDGRRSFATEDSSALPPSIVAGTTPSVDASWQPEATAPVWRDAITGKIDASSKWILTDATVENLPTSYPGGYAAYVHGGVAYTAMYPTIVAWDVATKAVLWVSPTDPDGINGWAGQCVSADGATIYSYAEVSLGSAFPPMVDNELWVRAQSTATGAVLWRRKATPTRYLGGGRTSGLVFDGTNLYVRYAITDSATTVTAMDLSGLDWGGYHITNWYAGVMTSLRVVAVKAADGSLLWDTLVSDMIPTLPWGPLLPESTMMMVGANVAFSYPEMTLPSSYTVHATQSSGLMLSTLDGMAITWRLASLNTTGGLTETTIETETWDLTNSYDTHRHSPIVPVGSSPSRIGAYMTGLNPALEAASRAGSAAVIVKNMDSSGTNHTVSVPAVVIVGGEEPGWSSTSVAYVTPYTVWFSTSTGMGAAQEFIPPDPGAYPNLRWYEHGGTVFGGGSIGATILQENGAITGTSTLLARITGSNLSTYAAVTDLAYFRGLIVAGGYGYTYDGSKTRRFS